MRKKTNTTEKWAKELKRHFAKKKVKVARTLRKRCSISLVVREYRVKLQCPTTAHPPDCQNLKKSGNTSVEQGVETQAISTAKATVCYCLMKFKM